MQSHIFAAGDTIISEGEFGDTAFVIVTGMVEVAIGQGRREKIVTTLKAGEVFGEMCLIEPGPRSATVTAASDVECVATTYEEFQTMVEAQPERAIAFMKTLVRRLRQMNDLVTGADPDKRGLRAWFRSWARSPEASPAGFEAGSSGQAMPMW